MPRIGKCSNFGLCGKADAREPISLTEGVAFECPECGRPLTAASGSGSRSGGAGLDTKKIGIIGGVVAALLAGVYFVLPKDPAVPGDPNAIVEPPSGGGGVVAPTGDPGLAPPGPGPVDPGPAPGPVIPPQPGPLLPGPGPITPSPDPGPPPGPGRVSRSQPVETEVSGVVHARLLSDLSTRTAREGDMLTLMVEDGPYRGSRIIGQVKKAKGPGKILGRGKSELAFQFEVLERGGQRIPIDAELRQISNSRGRANVDEEGRAIGTSMSKKGRGLRAAIGAGIGAGVGAVVGGGRGAAIGAGAGAAAGLVASYTIAANGPQMDLNKGSVFTLAIRTGR